MLSVLALLAAISCQKDNTDPSSPIGRQWYIDFGDGALNLYAFGEDLKVELSGVTGKALKSKTLYYNDDDAYDITDITKETGSDGRTVWLITSKGRTGSSPRTDRITDVTAKSAKWWYDEEVYYTMKPVRIKLEYRYVPRSANNLGLGVHWGVFDAGVTYDLNGNILVEPTANQVFNFYLDKDKYLEVYSGGAYYSWGETAAKSSYTTSTYQYADRPAVLPLEQDVAHKLYGGKWRMPTKAEYEEMLSQTSAWSCYSSNYSNKTVKYIEACGKKEGFDWKEIQFDFMGYKNGASKVGESGEGWFWTSTPASEGKAYALHVTENGPEIVEADCYLGLNVRPVWDPEM